MCSSWPCNVRVGLLTASTMPAHACKKHVFCCCMAQMHQVTRWCTRHAGGLYQLHGSRSQVGQHLRPGVIGSQDVKPAAHAAACHRERAYTKQGCKSRGSCREEPQGNNDGCGRTLPQVSAASVSSRRLTTPLRPAPSRLELGLPHILLVSGKLFVE